MTCPHKHVEARFWSQHFKDWKVIPVTMMAINPDALICRDCGEWLGLGESDEKPVADEIRAAEIELEARAGSASWRGRESYEWTGWLAFANCPDDCYGLRGDEAGFDAGWLAREIATHHNDPLAEAIEQAERAGV